MANRTISGLTARALSLTDLIPTQDAAGASEAGKNTISELKTTLALAKADVGLGNVDNTSDANKPVSTAQAEAIAAVSSVILSVKVSLTSAEILQLFTTPKVIIAAPGAGKLIQPIYVTYRMNYLTAAYATNVIMNLQYDIVQYVIGTNTAVSASTDTIVRKNTDDISHNFAAVNKGIALQMQTGNPTAGGGSLDVYILYTIIAL